MTKKQAYEHYKKLKRYEGDYIFNCYEKPSVRKVQIYEICRHRAYALGSRLWGITGYNSQKFTFSMIYEKDGLEWIEVNTGYRVWTFRTDELQG